jgi:DNA-binding winged helix-turn-helix (wHTH) protein
LWRTSSRGQASTPAAPPARWVCFGGFQLDQQQQALYKDGLPVKVQWKLFQALLALIETPGELVTREALRIKLWPRDTHLNYEANVNTTVNKLRQVLGDTESECKFIETIPRRGYSFIAEVKYADTPAAQAAAKGTEKSSSVRSILRRLAVPEMLRSSRARIWFTASVLAWVMAAVLFGAALVLYSHRSEPRQMVGRPADAQTGINP